MKTSIKTLAEHACSASRNFSNRAPKCIKWMRYQGQLPSRLPSFFLLKLAHPEWMPQKMACDSGLMAYYA